MRCHNRPMDTSSPQPLKVIGYWADETHPDYPDPRDLVDESWRAAERAEVVSYLEHQRVARAFMGVSLCRMCGRRNGSLELTDGTYVWPDGLAHYVRDHGVRLPQPFVDHVVDRTGRSVDQEVSAVWWLDHARRTPVGPDVGSEQVPDEELLEGEWGYVLVQVLNLRAGEKVVVRLPNGSKTTVSRCHLLRQAVRFGQAPTHDDGRINVGDIYEDCACHPVLCTDVDYEEDYANGISLLDGSRLRGCSLRHCGVRRLTVADVVTL